MIRRLLNSLLEFLCAAGFHDWKADGFNRRDWRVTQKCARCGEKR